MNQQIPILFLGDAPSLNSGLARIGRDLATQLSRLPQYRVAYLGRGSGAHLGGGIADSRLPFMQYTYQPTADNQWGARELPDVWNNWSRGERGVVFTIWDPSRLTWFGNPQPQPEGSEYAELSRFLLSGRFERWGYFAIDAEGPGEGGALTGILADTLAGYDRVLAYSRFGKRVIEASLSTVEQHGQCRTCGYSYRLAKHVPVCPNGADHDIRSTMTRVDWLPHGYIGSAFQPRDRAEARRRMRIPDNTTLIGCVMANQPRKDWGLWARAMQLVVRELPNVLLWAHIDSINRYWDLRILLDTFGLGDRVIVTTDSPSDVEMSWRYSACDLTVLPSLGEGFGYPIVESQACGVPVVHGDYAAGAELIAHALDSVVSRYGLVLDTRYCMMRPVYEPRDWAERIIERFELQAQLKEPPCRHAIRHVEHLDWNNLWPRAWRGWWDQGAREFAARNVR